MSSFIVEAMLFTPSPKPLTRIIALGDEALLLESLSGIQNNAASLHLAKEIDAEALIEIDWQPWWFAFEGESHRFYCSAPQSRALLQKSLFYQSFSVLLWIVEKASKITDVERGFLRAIAFAGAQQAVVLYSQPSTDKDEALIREHLQEAGFDGNKSLIICGESGLTSTHQEILQALA